MSPLRATYRFERTLWNRGFRLVAGVDEVGMGCLAGPVVAAAVILPAEIRIDFVRDSKTLSGLQRMRLAEQIKRSAVAWAIGDASPHEIATLNLHWAAVEAMRRALAALRPPPDAVLTDAYQIPDLPWYHEAIIKGDRKVRSIAAASIVAKVHRDALMARLDQEHPGYGFAEHKGYATKQHQEALHRLGPCPIHRPSFAPVAEALSGRSRAARGRLLLHGRRHTEEAKAERTAQPAAEPPPRGVADHRAVPALQDADPAAHSLPDVRHLSRPNRDRHRRPRGQAE